MGMIGISSDWDEGSWSYSEPLDLSHLSVQERLDFYGATIEYTDPEPDTDVSSASYLAKFIVGIQSTL